MKLTFTSLNYWKIHQDHDRHFKIHTKPKSKYIQITKIVCVWVLILICGPSFYSLGWDIISDCQTRFVFTCTQGTHKNWVKLNREQRETWNWGQWNAYKEKLFEMGGVLYHNQNTKSSHFGLKRSCWDNSSLNDSSLD